MHYDICSSNTISGNRPPGVKSILMPRSMACIYTSVCLRLIKYIPSSDLFWVELANDASDTCTVGSVQ